MPPQQTPWTARSNLRRHQSEARLNSALLLGADVPAKPNRAVFDSGRKHASSNLRSSEGASRGARFVSLPLSSSTPNVPNGFRSKPEHW